jgi:hypothetical protein
MENKFFITKQESYKFKVIFPQFFQKQKLVY